MHNLVISSVASSVFYNGAGIGDLPGLPIPNGVKSLYWDTNNSIGWIENLDDSGNYIGNTDITELPSWADNCLAIFKEIHKPFIPPTPQEICKNLAKELLADTDWVEMPSASDTANTPHLLNLSDFLLYRNQLRVLAVNPIDNPQFPTKPSAQWSR
jgi:hypothetical protein